MSMPLCRWSLSHALLPMLVLGLSGGAWAEEPAQAPKPVKVEVTAMTTDFGNLHVLVLPVALNLSSQSSVAAVASGHFQFSPNVMASATVVFPYMGIGGKDTDTKWFQLDLRGTFMKTLIAQETERIPLRYDRKSQRYSFGRLQVREITTDEEFVTVPAYSLKGGGMNVGVMARSGLASVMVDKDRMDKTLGRYFTAYLGVAALNAMGLTANVEGYGGMANYRWLTAGADVLIDVVRSYDVEPAEPRTRFGLRAWTETIFARRYGLAGRLELGYMPSGGGVYVLAAVGGGLNLGL